MVAVGRSVTRFTVDDEPWLALVLEVAMEDVRGGRGGLMSPPGALLVLLPVMALVWAAETVVTLDVTEDASLPDEPGALNSSSNDGRDRADGLDEPSGESGDGSGFMPGRVAGRRLVASSQIEE